MPLSTYIPLCDAMVHLLQPLVEVVIHDIEADQIVYINGSLSSRKIGDPSLLEKESLADIDKIIYPKINFDGRLIKSTSVLLEEKWLLCLNADVSVFNKMHELSKILLQNREENQPKSLFVNDWQEKLHGAIHTYLQNHNLSYDHLTSANKKAIVKHLFDLNAFQEKKAADYIAEILNLGRATVFNYLKEWRNK